MRNMILVSGGSDAAREQLERAFGENFVTAYALDEKEAIKLIAENGKKLCALLVDTSLPSGGAFSVIKFMSATNLVGKFPVVFISSFNIENDEMQEFAEEIDDIIEKPLNVEIIKRRVRNLVELYNYRRSSKKNPTA